MVLDKKIEEELVRFKRSRDSLISADAKDVLHHLKAFVREIQRNGLLAPILEALPDLDPDVWWSSNVKSKAVAGRVDSIEFPEDEDERIVIFLDLAKSMASDTRDLLSIHGFGQMLGRHDTSGSASAAVSLVLRPLSELLGDRIREQVGVANPAIRELAGVPLDRIPGDGETRIFLSHRSADKEIVRPFYNLLKSLGFEPWLDEKEIKAGSTIHREISSGFDSACAVVFFVTSSFEDERWIGREIDHAVSREIEHSDRFSVIALVFGDATVPRALRDKRWVDVKNHVDAVREVVEALPVELGPARWRKS